MGPCLQAAGRRVNRAGVIDDFEGTAGPLALPACPQGRLEMIENWKKLADAGDLLYTWTLRELKVRYAGSLLGLAWTVVYPLALLLVSTMMFAWFLRVPTQGIPPALFLYCGLTPWLFSNNAIQSSAFALFANLQLVKNASFPREILPLATLFVGAVDFAVSSLLLAGMVLYYRLPVGITLVLVPVLVVIQFMLTLALSLFVSASLVFFRDIRFLVPIAMQLLMYLSPVFYPIDLVPKRGRFWYLLNPFAALIDAYRRVILFRSWPAWQPLLWAAVVSVVALVAAYVHFKRVEWEFADRI
jgi:lipopolysaccharide transport system permease protein